MRSTRRLFNLIRLTKPNRSLFSEQNNKKGFVTFLKNAWKQTFPQEEDEVRARHKKTKQTKRFTQEQLEQMQQDIHQYKRTALVQTQEKAKEEQKKFKVSSIIPESVKKKIQQSESFKQYKQFKENVKEFVSTREGVAANVGTYVYGTVTQGSTLARATEIMRKYIPDFSIFDLEKQATVIFKDAYHKFMNGDSQPLEKMSAEQAYQYFQANIRINKQKGCKPKYTQFIHNYPADLSGANFGEKTLPSFVFQMRVMEIYCMINNKGQIVDGDDQRIMEVTYYFTLSYNGNHLDDLGHPWQITEIRKINEVKLLV